MRASVPVQSGDPQSLRGRHGRVSRQQQPAGDRQHQALPHHHHGQPGEPGDEGRAAAEDRSARVVGSMIRFSFLSRLMESNGFVFEACIWHLNCVYVKLSVTLHSADIMRLICG